MGEEITANPLEIFNIRIVGKIVYLLGKKEVFFYRERSFWNKWYKFLTEVSATDEDREKFIKKLSENDSIVYNAQRILDCIDRVTTEQKVHYLVNASICFSNQYINKSEYFRICDAIIRTLDEDLKFLGEHINNTDIKYSLEVQGLLNSGLINANTNNVAYSFNSLAKFVDKYAVNFENRVRYPDLNEKIEITEPSRIFLQ